MPIDLKTETIIALTEGRRKFPRKPTYHQLMRWADFGIYSRSHRKVFLEIIKIGPEICTSQEAFERFCNALTEDDFIADDKDQRTSELLSHFRSQESGGRS